MSGEIAATLTRNWPLKLAALLLSLTLYVAVAANEQTTQSFPVALEVQTPPGRTLRQPPPPVSVEVRARGSEMLKLRELPRGIALHVPDTLTAAEWLVVLHPTDVELPRGADIQVTEVLPREVTIQLSPVAVKMVPVAVRVAAAPDSGILLDGGLTVTPAKVRILGPDPLIAPVDSVLTDPLRLPAQAGAFRQSVGIDTISLGIVRVWPRVVEVSGTAILIVQRTFADVPVESGAGSLAGFTLRPDRVTITVRGPESLLATLPRDSLKVIAVLPGASGGFARLKVLAPRGVTVQVVPDSVEVRRRGRG